MAESPSGFFKASGTPEALFIHYKGFIFAAEQHKYFAYDERTNERSDKAFKGKNSRATLKRSFPLCL